MADVSIKADVRKRWFWPLPWAAVTFLYFVVGVRELPRWAERAVKRAHEYRILGGQWRRFTNG